MCYIGVGILILCFAVCSCQYFQPLFCLESKFGRLRRTPLKVLTSRSPFFHLPCDFVLLFVSGWFFSKLCLWSSTVLGDSRRRRKSYCGLGRGADLRFSIWAQTSRTEPQQHFRNASRAASPKILLWLTFDSFRRKHVAVACILEGYPHGSLATGRFLSPNEQNKSHSNISWKHTSVF